VLIVAPPGTNVKVRQLSPGARDRRPARNMTEAK